jgi:gamma-carbonic anhydrase
VIKMANSGPIQTWPKIEGSIPASLVLPYPEEKCDPDAVWSRPLVDPTAWVSPGAVILGRVRLKAHSSVWFGTVLRGDDAYIEVGSESNVQDGSILHIEPGHPCILGDRVTLGHRATVHASVVEDDAMIGIGATVLSRATIGEGALIAAGALVLEDTKVAPGTLWAGVPARQIRELTPLQKERMRTTYKHYVNLAKLYQKRFAGNEMNDL